MNGTSRILTSFVFLILLAGVSQASAATCTWTGAVDDKWSTAGNWSCGHKPANGDDLQFNLPTALHSQSVNDIDGLSVPTIRFTNRPNSGFDYVVTGTKPLTVTSRITVEQQPQGARLACPVKVGADGVRFENLGGTPNVSFASLQLGDVDLNGFSLIVDARFPIDVSGSVTGPATSNISVLGNGTTTSFLTLEQDNTFTGGLLVQGGAINALKAGSFGNPAGPAIVLNDGVTVNVLNAEIAKSFQVTGDVTFTLSGANITGAINGVPGVTLFVNVPLGAVGSLRGVVTGFQITKTGAGVLAMASASPTLPWLNVAAGNVQLGANQSIGTLIGAAGTTLALGASTLTVNQTAAFDFAGTITGTGNLIKNGNARLTLTGANTYTGTTTINAGILRTAMPLQMDLNARAILGPIVVTGGTLAPVGQRQFADNTPLTLTAPGTMDLTQAQDTFVGSLTGTGDIALGPSGLTIGPNNASTTYSGAINGTGNLTKLGTGTLTLSGTVVSGGMQISKGGVLANGTVNAASVINVSDALIGGSGTVGKISGQGVAISPGNSPGILHTGLITPATLTLVEQLNGNAPGTGYDQVIVADNMTIGAGSTLQATLGFEPQQNATFTIASVAAGKFMLGTFDGLPEGKEFPVGDRHFKITYHGGDGNDIVLTATDKPPAITYFLSEGATGNFFDTDILITNPNETEAPVTLTFSKENGEQVVKTETIPAQTRVTVHVDSIPGLEATSASTRVTSTTGLPLVVERSMFWDASYYAGSTGSSVDQPAQDWLFAEGSQGFFQTFVLVINPNTTPTDVTFTFFRESDTPVTKTITVPASTRLTLDCGSVPEIVNRSFGIAVHGTQPIMAERSMYFGTTDKRLWSGGTESAGVSTTSTHWFMAEGATGGFFTTFVLLSNPGAQDAHVTFQYLLDTGATISVQKLVPAHTRLTTNIGAEDDQRLHNAAVSTVVTSDQPIIAERSMYWLGAAQPWGEGHNSFGVVDAGLVWGLSEGRSGGQYNFHTYILLANPQTTPAAVTVTFLREHGAPVTKTFNVPATSRFNVDTATIDELKGDSFGALVEVTNNVPIIVERSMYWDSNGFTFSGGTNATGIPFPAPR